METQAPVPVVAVSPISASELRDALDTAVRDSLRPVSLWLGMFLVVLAASHWLVLPRSVMLTAVALAAISAMVVLGIRLAQERWSVSPRWANAAGAALMCVGLVNGLAPLYLAAVPQLTVNLALVVLASSLLLLDTRWWIGLVVVTLAGWLTAWALAAFAPDWLYFGLGLLLALGLAAIVHLARVRSVQRMETLRIEEQAERAEMQAALARSQESRRLAEALVSVGGALTGSLELSQVLNSVMEGLAEIVNHDRCSVMLATGTEAEIVASRGFPENSEGTRIRVSLTGEDNNIFRQMYLSHRPLPIPDVSQRPDWQYVPGLRPARSWLGVPLLRSNNVVGMLSITRETLRPFDDNEITQAMTFASQAAIALDNARLYDDIKRAYAQLERLDRTKSDFIEIASHELRTPITVIQTANQILYNSERIKSDDDLRQTVAGAQSGTQRLLEIVESMLDMAKIDSRALKLHPKPLVMPMLIQMVCKGYKKTLEERRLELTVEDMGGLPPVAADLDALRKVFYHLVGNAIKYTPDGGKITISAHTLSVAQPGLPEKGIEIVVSDTGIGIDPQHHELIFEKFRQTGQVATHSSGKTKFKGGGPGLGLAIARGIVQAHGGKLWVESPGYNEQTLPGSQFHVVLPLRPAAFPQQAVTQNGASF